MEGLKSKKAVIIGGGRVGTAIGLQMKKTGFNLLCIVEKSARQRKKIGEFTDTDIIKSGLSEKIVRESEIIIICTKDDEIETALQELKEFNLKIGNKIIFHTSGMHNSGIIEKYGIRKANCGSFHPVQTFSKCNSESDRYLSGIYISLEGGKTFREYGKLLIREWESETFILKPEDKVTYHLICVLSSNLLIAYFKLISELGERIGISVNRFNKIFFPLIRTAMENMVKDGFEKSLTGPIARGDYRTIQKHKSALGKHRKEIEMIYRMLGNEALKLSVKKKSINTKSLKEIKKILKAEK